MTTRKLTPEEIADRQNAATEYWQTVKVLENDLIATKLRAKQIKAQISEAQRNMDTLMGEIAAGEVESESQGKLV
jgi:septal ring factor EnvC (AmiA/AmiB activator)